jgi:outer membrane protein assembly factor BamB
VQQFEPDRDQGDQNDQSDQGDPDRDPVDPSIPSIATSQAWGRRRFGRYLSLFLGSTIASLLGSRRAAAQSRRAILPIAISDTVRAQVNTLINDVRPTIPETELLIPTYLGSAQRRFYGRGQPNALQTLNRFYLGSGISIVGGTADTWSGAGWTGQPTIVRDRGKLFLTIGAYDHSLRKLDLDTMQVVWRYEFDDILKGSASIYLDETAEEDDRLVILQGSRRGVGNALVTSNPVPSFRAISFRTGRELWRLNIRLTDSYSRDNDSSAIALGNGELFNVGENAIGYFLNASAARARQKDGIIQPQIIQELKLYEDADIAKYRGNLVAEASPAILGDRLYVASGGGRIYGIEIASRTVVWRFQAGGDLNGSIAISRDGKLFATVDREKIPGLGGAFKLDPTRPDPDCVDWFMPTLDRGYGDWEGGITASVALNDDYRSAETPPLFATSSVDGNLYIGSQTETSGTAFGPLNDRRYPTPKILATYPIGASISTPIFTDGNRLIAAGYGGIHLFQMAFEVTNTEADTAESAAQTAIGMSGTRYRLTLELLDRVAGSFESTPIVWDGKIYICSRDGWLYTFGQPSPSDAPNNTPNPTKKN